MDERVEGVEVSNRNEKREFESFIIRVSIKYGE